MKKKKNYYIECPCCGQEYLPEEIYIPSQFFGKPKNIIKDKGKIISFLGNTLNTTEKFICEQCNKEFTIDCKISFISQYDDKYDFNEDWYEEQKNSFILSED